MAGSGSPELVLDGCGYVVPKGDAGAILEKIESVKNEKFDTVAETGRENFDKNECYKKYLSIYKEMSEKSK